MRPKLYFRWTKSDFEDLKVFVYENMLKNIDPRLVELILREVKILVFSLNKTYSRFDAHKIFYIYISSVSSTQNYNIIIKHKSIF